MNSSKAALIFVVLLLIAFAGPAAQKEPNANAAAPRITILYDAFGKSPAMQQDWGFAAPAGSLHWRAYLCRLKAGVWRSLHLLRSRSRREALT